MLFQTGLAWDLEVYGAVGEGFSDCQKESSPFSDQTNLVAYEVLKQLDVRDAPVVIANGGFSGIFPHSSGIAYQLALLTGLPNMILSCDVQLTKDGFGICARDLQLNNCTDIALGVYKDNRKSYFVNGVPTLGWFSVDYNLSDLQQNVFCNVEQWTNISLIHDMFFSQFNLSMRNYVISVSKRVVVNYISSPEVGFLRNIVARFRGSPTKLVFCFLEMESVEPSTNQTYGSLLKNLTFIKTFASGILVPKTYIWPVSTNQYLLPHTSVVSDAHTAGLEVFASGFANDAPLSYNFSFDPLAESLAFVDDANFSVDGVLSDFPITPSLAIGKPVIISRNGASGDYPGSTDMAYKKAVEDGADFIDCSVQITSDQVLVCLNSIDLIDGTDVIQSPFNSRLVKIPDLQPGAGIFTFNFTWEEIQTLKPKISDPYLDYKLVRNPDNANAGKFMTLANFLTFAQTQKLSGIVFRIENALFLAEKLSLDLTDAVIKALSTAGYDNQTALDVMIQSSNSAVLEKLKQQTKYKRLYEVDESIRDAQNSSLLEIKSFADHVAIKKNSVYPENKAFVTTITEMVRKLQSFDLAVYVYVFQNEFVAQAWDFYSDATVEMNSYVQGAGADGVITEFPKTASRYRSSPCLQLKSDQMPIYMAPVQPGGLLSLMITAYLPPTQAPLPILTDSDVEEPPLPSVSVQTPSPPGGNISRGPSASPSPSGQPRTSACAILSTLGMLLASVLLV
ncbi:hypothetical protein ACLOJK_035757 [Asimina triloba]